LPIYVVLDGTHTGLARSPLFVVRFAVTLAVATASYVLVERPIRRGRLPGAGLRVATPAIAGALLLTLVTVTAGAVELRQSRPTPPSAATLQRLVVDAQRRHAQRVLVVGNSVASSLAVDGFTKLATRPATEVADDGIASCDFPPSRLVRDVHAPAPSKPYDCTAPWRTAVRTFRPHVVILVLGDVHQQEYLLGGRWLSECDRAFAPRFRRALTRAVRRLRAEGAHVVLTTAAYSIFLGGESAMAPVRTGTKCVNSMIRGFARGHPEVGLVDLARFVCPHGDECRSTIDGASVRPDGVHYQGRGARVVAAWVYRHLGIDAGAPSFGACGSPPTVATTVPSATGSSTATPCSTPAPTSPPSPGAQRSGGSTT
jgi:hypothetical protein